MILQAGKEKTEENQQEYLRNKLMYKFCSLFFLVFLVGKEPDMVFIKGNKEIKGFWIDVSPVTVAQFSKFVEVTGFVTEAEKFGNGGVFDFNEAKWDLVDGANWRYPFGPDQAKAEDNHPVTQVSWNDAQAYAEWAGKRLPTSEEFVYAEKNGNKNHKETYTWGENFKEGEKYKANFWQGTFPLHNTEEDGFLATSPVGQFGKNKLGLTDMGGNVWQWCSDESLSRHGEMNQRGGSFLCDPSVCHGFKIGGVASSSPETSLVHVGFRCVR